MRDSQVEALRGDRKTAVGDAVLCASFLAYAGPFATARRALLWRGDWVPDLVSRGITLGEGADPVDLLTSEPLLAQWALEGLPGDRASTENGVLVSRTLELRRRWPLLVDPQGQGLAWIKARELSRLHGSAAGAAPEPGSPVPLGSVASAAGGATALAGKAPTALGESTFLAAPEVLVVAPSEADWLLRVASAVQHGRAVVVTGLDASGAPLALQPLIEQATYKRGRNLLVRFLGEEVRRFSVAIWGRRFFCCSLSYHVFFVLPVFSFRWSTIRTFDSTSSLPSRAQSCPQRSPPPAPP